VVPRLRADGFVSGFTVTAMGDMLLNGRAAAVNQAPLPRNVFLVTLRKPVSQAAVSRPRQQFPGTVLPAVPPPEVRDLSGVSDLPLVLALVLMLLASGIIAHTLVTSVHRRRRQLAVLKTLGFVAWQVRATVAWQATAIATVSLIVALPLGLAVGRWAWTVLANAIAAIPARAAARTQPGVVLRAG